MGAGWLDIRTAMLARARSWVHCKRITESNVGVVQQHHSIQFSLLLF